MDEIKIRCSCCGKKITRDDVYFKVVLIDESNNAGIRDYFCENCYRQLRQFKVEGLADLCKRAEYFSETNIELGILGE